MHQLPHRGGGGAGEENTNKKKISWPKGSSISWSNGKQERKKSSDPGNGRGDDERLGTGANVGCQRARRPKAVIEIFGSRSLLRMGPPNQCRFFRYRFATKRGCYGDFEKQKNKQQTKKKKGLTQTPQKKKKKKAGFCRSSTLSWA